MFCSINGNKIYYKEIGKGLPIISLHGFPEDHQAIELSLEPIFKTLNGYKRIYLDLPGMGLSKANETLENADEMLKIIIAFIKEIIGEEHFLLVGNSYGGYLTLGLLQSSLKDYIDGCLFLCPCIEPNRELRKLPIKKRIVVDDFILKNESDPIVQDFLEYAVIATNTTFERYKKEILSGLNRANQEFIEKYQQYGYSFSFHDELHGITFNKPVVFLLGKQDHCVGYEDSFPFIHSFSRATYAILDSSGHNLQIERTPLFNAFFIDWIDRIEKDRLTTTTK